MMTLSNVVDDLFASPVPLYFAPMPMKPKHSVGPKLQESDTEYTMMMSLPGLRPSDLQLTFEDNYLCIRGESTVGEQRYTASHQLRVPHDVDTEAARATAENGIVTIHLPKRTPATHLIPVADKADALGQGAETDYLLRFVVPGIRPSELKLSCTDGVLSVEGGSKTEGRELHVSQRKRLPEDADVGAATAAAEHGILTIRLPRRAEAKEKESAARRVPVNDKPLTQEPAQPAAA